MKTPMTRIPLAIALTSAMAFAVGCADNTTVDDRTGMDETADERASHLPPTGSETVAPEPADRDVTYGEAVADGSPADRLDDGMDSDQPVDDTWITTKVKSSLLADSDVAGTEVSVETINGVVHLSGYVDDQRQIDRAVEVARDIEGVTRVESSGLQLKTSDTD